MSDLDKALNDSGGSAVGIRTIERFDDYLSDKAKAVHQTKAELVPATKILTVRGREHLQIRFLGKGIVVEKDSPTSQEDVERFAKLFSYYVDHGHLEHGMLSPAMEIDLAPWCKTCGACYGTLGPRTVEEVHAECIEKHGSAPPPLEYRRMLLAYAASRYTREELNEVLPAESFTEEGLIPKFDWPEIPQ